MRQKVRREGRAERGPFLWLHKPEPRLARSDGSRPVGDPILAGGSLLVS
jgi:hypothetical protein